MTIRKDVFPAEDLVAFACYRQEVIDVAGGQGALGADLEEVRHQGVGDALISEQPALPAAIITSTPSTTAHSHFRHEHRSTPISHSSIRQIH